MFPLYSPKSRRRQAVPPSPYKKRDSQLQKPTPRFRIPHHFKKNNIVTYSQSEIEKELKKYPGLLKTLGHAYQYQIIFNSDEYEKQYWFCRNLEVTMPLLKYLNERNWSIDWQEKPFVIK